MIRMGRSSRSDLPETNDYNGTSSATPSYQYGNESQPAASPRVVTDSESIARDIKEGRLSGFVGHGTVLTGETNFQMMLRVDGHLTGSVSSDGGTLIVGTNGQVDANVSVGVATINGVVNGDVIASEKIQLGRTARVMGNIATPRLIIEEGAVFEGGCSMMRAREEEESATAAAAQEQYRAAEASSYSTTAVSSTDDDDDDDDDFLSSDSEEEEDETVTV